MKIKYKHKEKFYFPLELALIKGETKVFKQLLLFGGSWTRFQNNSSQNILPQDVYEESSNSVVQTKNQIQNVNENEYKITNKIESYFSGNILHAAVIGGRLSSLTYLVKWILEREEEMKVEKEKETETETDRKGDKNIGKGKGRGKGNGEGKVKVKVKGNQLTVEGIKRMDKGESDSDKDISDSNNDISHTLYKTSYCTTSGTFTPLSLLLRSVDREGRTPLCLAQELKLVRSQIVHKYHFI